jgi:hypothetical protein
MAGMKLEGFNGLIPRTSDRLLTPMSATVARNTKILSGELRGFRRLTEEVDLTGCTSVLRRAYRVPGGGVGSIEWLCFNTRDIDIVRSPLVNDTFDRYYWAGVGERPQMNTADNIHTGLPPYWLGIPIPTRRQRLPLVQIPVLGK